MPVLIIVAETKRHDGMREEEMKGGKKEGKEEMKGRKEGIKEVMEGKGGRKK